MPLNLLADRTTELFTKCFGRKPRWVVAAPGRVNLLGEHTDYNDGFVLPMALERYTVIAGDRSGAKEVTFHSETTGETARFSLRVPIRPGEPQWSNYIRGVVAGFEKLGTPATGFDAALESSLPYGGGLASSAALEVAVATLLETMRGQRLDPLQKALLCQQAEHDFAGVPCGIMDQFTSILAQPDQAILLDCRSRTTTAVPMRDPEVTVLIVNTNVRHQLATSEYPKRRKQCEIAAAALGVPALRDASRMDLQSAASRMDPVVFRRARHVITENERTLLAARAMQASDWLEFGRLMYASHASLRDDYEVSCRELDAVVEVARELGQAGGVYGCRMTGAGFGGCAVSLVKTSLVQVITRKISEAYERRTRNEPMIFSSRPAGGARVLRSAPTDARPRVK